MVELKYFLSPSCFTPSDAACSYRTSAFHGGVHVCKKRTAFSICDHRVNCKTLFRDSEIIVHLTPEQNASKDKSPLIFSKN